MSGSQHKFRIGDPVWAKMKGFSPWPGKVCMPPSDIKRPAIKKQMHCVNFFGTNDFAWIEENNMKDYEQYKETLIKDKKTKQMASAIEEIEKYISERDTTQIDEEEEFDALVSGREGQKGVEKVREQKKRTQCRL